MSGIAATYVMGLATTTLRSVQSDQDRKREEAVSRGVAYEMAADRAASLAGVTLSPSQRSAAGLAVHYGLGAAGALIYPLLRRRGWGAGVAAIVTAVSLEVVVDQALNPVLGLTAPPQRYPASTHVRGVLGHLVYGLSVAAFVELARRRLRRD